MKLFSARLTMLLALTVISSVAGQCPNGNWTWSSDSGSCYMVVSTAGTSYTYYDAVSNCNQLNNSLLLSIDTVTEQQFINQLLAFNYEPLWIGVTYNATIGQWTLADGWANNYTASWSSTPNSLLPCTSINKATGVLTTVYNPEAQWISVSCTTQLYGYICEIPGPRCSDVPTVANASASSWKNYYQQTVTYSCFDGYIIPQYLNSNSSSGDTSVFFSQSITCNAVGDGTYTWYPNPANLSSCTPKFCTTSPVSYNTSQGLNYPACDICGTNAAYYIGGTTATYTCQNGFKVPYLNSTYYSVVCGTNPFDPLSNTWKPTSVTCSPVQCPSFSSFAPTSYTLSGTSYLGNTIKKGESLLYTQWGTTLTFTCNAGYIYADSQLSRTYQCNNTGTVGFWNLIAPSGAAFSASGCNPVQCANWTTRVLQLVNSGQMNITSGEVTNTAYNSMFTVACPDNYAFPDGTTSKQFICGTSQLWSTGGTTYQSIPTCMANPETNLDLPPNGQQYSPPAVEVPTAVNNVAPVFILVGLVMTVILIMDIAVLPRDFIILRQSCERLKVRCQKKQTEDTKPLQIEPADFGDV